jgi:hypothetical protein
MEDKRRHKRYSVNGLQGDIFNPSEMSVINMNMRGIGVETTKKLEPSGECLIRILCKDTEWDFRGRMVWTLPVKKETKDAGAAVHVYRAGIRFTDLTEEKTECIIRHINGERSTMIERRLSGMRFEVANPGNFKIYLPSKFVIRNISLSGMLIETEDHMARNSHCDMRLPLNGRALNISGRVVHLSNGAPKPHPHQVMGVEFVNVADEDRSALAHFIETLDLT